MAAAIQCSRLTPATVSKTALYLDSRYIPAKPLETGVLLSWNESRLVGRYTPGHVDTLAGDRNAGFGSAAVPCKC